MEIELDLTGVSSMDSAEAYEYLTETVVRGPLKLCCSREPEFQGPGVVRRHADSHRADLSFN